MIVTEAKQLDGLIIIANGTPDDIVLSIICYHSNGDRIVGIVKPKQTYDRDGSRGSEPGFNL